MADTPIEQTVQGEKSNLYIVQFGGCYGIARDPETAREQARREFAELSYMAIIKEGMPR
jgi:hypothetical protein